MSTLVRTVVFSCSLLVFTCAATFGQSTQPATNPSPEGSSAQQSNFAWKSDSESSGPGVGVAVKFSLLGAGIETAMRVSHRSNVRAGFNMFSYDRTFDKDG